MHRRRFLQTMAAGGGLMTPGCVALGEDSDPFNFGITNWRNQRYLGDVVLRKNGETVILDARVDIPARRSADADPTGILVRDITDVVNGDVIDARIHLDQTEFETRYEVTCTSSENAENNLFFRIFSSENREMQFAGSEC